MSFKIYIIGAGRVGSTLGNAINGKEFQITHIYSHTRADESFLNSHFPNTTFWHSLEKKPVADCNVLVITVPDDALEECVQQLAVLFENWNDKICIHTSGLLSSSVLEPLKLKGAAIASLHPMQTINTRVANPTILENIMLTFEGSTTAKGFCKAVAKKLSARFREISRQDKLQYHLGGTVAANLFTGLVSIAAKLFSEGGFKDFETAQMIKQLNNRVLENYSQSNLKDTLTGPLQRGDEKTIRLHLDYINKNHPEFFQVYRSLSKYILDHFTEHPADLYQKLDTLLK